MLVSLTESYPQQQNFRPASVFNNAASNKRQAAVPAASGGKDGQVKMQVYRGPSQASASGKQSGSSGGPFAPWGFYVTQQEDGLGRR